MSSLLFGISIAALLSTTSLLVVLLRVSPLLAPAQAVPAFILSLFLSVTTISSLLFLGIWKLFPNLTWDTGKLTSTALRQGIFLGCAMVIVVVFHMLHLLNWWIALCIIGVFVLVEAALEH